MYFNGTFNKFCVFARVSMKHIQSPANFVHIYVWDLEWTPNFRNLQKCNKKKKKFQKVSCENGSFGKVTESGIFAVIL